MPDDIVLGLHSAGGVNVFYGTGGGLSTTGNQFWTQDSPGVEEVAEVGDRFGTALATADFNGDGFTDLAIGVPGESVGAVQAAGAVNVLYGSDAGLSPTSNQIWSQDSRGVKDSAESSDSFGTALAAGDFNGDGYSDLAIGDENEYLGDIINAGAVNVLYGWRRASLPQGTSF